MKKELILQVRGRKILFGRNTWIMGILNVTPDSFSDGGQFKNAKQAAEHGLRLIDQGADILDVGGESTRPGAAFVSEKEEMNRVVPVIQELRKHTDALISVDTTKKKVLEESLNAGADILNDISAMRFDPDMLPFAAEKKVPVILMHMRGTPENMAEQTHYPDLLGEIKNFFIRNINRAADAGLTKDRLIIDPGIGFAKNMRQNLQLIRNLHVFSDLEIPILIGVSRKSFIGRILNLPPEKRVEGTIAASVIAMQAGAHILRVHDASAVRRAVRVAEAILEQPVSAHPCPPKTPEDKQHVH